MMTMTLRIVLILVSLGTFAMIIRKIRESKMQIESAIFWIMLSIVLVLYSIFPKLAEMGMSWYLIFELLFHLKPI